MCELGSRMNETYAIDIFNLVQEIGYIPYADITEFGCLCFDHVPSIHLNFCLTLAVE